MSSTPRTPLTPWGPVSTATPDSEMEARILDVAFARFAAHGIAGTTMSQLAADVGISRVWLYRHYPNRDAVVTALVARETERLLAGLRARFVVSGDPLTLVQEAFVYAVAFLRGHEVLQRILVTEPDSLVPFLFTDAGPVMRLAADAVTDHLHRGAGMAPDDARVVAETLSRLALSIALTGRSSLDFDDPDELRRFAATLVPRLLNPDRGGGPSPT